MTNNAQIFSLTLYPDEIETLRSCAKQEGLSTHQDMCRAIIRIYLNELKQRAYKDARTYADLEEIAKKLNPKHKTHGEQVEENIKAVRAARKSNGKK